MTDAIDGLLWLLSAVSTNPSHAVPSTASRLPATSLQGGGGAPLAWVSPLDTIACTTRTGEAEDEGPQDLPEHGQHRAEGMSRPAEDRLHRPAFLAQPMAASSWPSRGTFSNSGRCG
jgi:hypothetical protein